VKSVDARRYLPAGLIVGITALVVVLAVTPWDAPRPASAAAPAAAFSSARAMDLLRVVAAEPHAIGSARAAVVRDFIHDRLEELALYPHVQTAEVVSQREPRVAGIVHNVVGRLPGRDPSRAVLFVAHYDSVPTAPGAADDGSGVAALLETARALRAGPPPRNDVIFLFTDGEERGLLGSQAFLERDPWAYAAGVVLNFDSAGSSSPALMYETSPGNGELIAHYLAAGRPYGSSLMYEVSRRQTVVSDFRPLVARGIPGMTFGMLDGPAYGHTAYDSLSSFDETGLQHKGETALALARRLGDADLWRLHAPDVVYFDLAGGVAVSYPGSYVLPFVVLAVALFAAAAGIAAGRRLLTPRGVAWAVLGTLATLAASLLVVAVVWTMYRTAYEERVWTGTGVVISDLYRLGLVLLATAVVLGIYVVLLRRLRAWDLAVVALAWWTAGAVGVSLAFPGASYLLTWSLVGGSLGLIGAAFLDRQSDIRPAAAFVALAGAVPGLALMSSAVYLLLMSAGLKQGVTVLAVWLLAGLLTLPLAVALRAFRFWLPAALAVAGAIVLFSVGSTVAFDSEHPKFTSISYRLAANGEATWQSIDRTDEYTRGFLGDYAIRGADHSYFPQFGAQTTVEAAADSYGLRPPSLELVSDVTVGDRRTVEVHLRSRRGAAVLSLLVHTIVGSLSASVDGHELAGRDTTLLDGTTVRWSFDFYAPPPEGVEVKLAFAAGPAVLLRAVDFTYGLPPGAAGAYPARPAGMLPCRLGDGTLTETTLRLPGEER
jgi:Peptidase family M28